MKKVISPCKVSVVNLKLGGAASPGKYLERSGVMEVTIDLLEVLGAILGAALMASILTALFFACRERYEIAWCITFITLSIIHLIG